MIRRARMTDAPVIQKLLAQLGYLLTLQEAEHNLQLYLQDEDREVFIAQVDGQMVGFLALDMAQTFHRVQRQMRIISLVVDEARRGQGVGKRLLEEAERLAEEKGCWAIDLTSSVRREKGGTHRFYQSLGYEKNGSQAYFRKLLGGLTENLDKSSI